MKKHSVTQMNKIISTFTKMCYIYQYQWFLLSATVVADLACFKKFLS